MWDVDGTNIDGFHFMGTGSYRFGSEEQLEEYQATTWGPSAVEGKHVIGGDGEEKLEKSHGKGFAHA